MNKTKLYWIMIIFIAGCSGQPKNIGHEKNHLKMCEKTPNCVSSMDDRESFKVQKIKYKMNKEEGIKHLLKIVEKKGGKLVANDGDYYHFEFTSKVFRFVDDFELFFQEDAAEVSSRSRVGRSDFGVNRTRVEEVRFSYQQNEY